jgi:hypothetical protein
MCIKPETTEAKAVPVAPNARQLIAGICLTNLPTSKGAGASAGVALAWVGMLQQNQLLKLALCYPVLLQTYLFAS